MLVRDSALPAAALDDGAVVLSLRAGAYFDFNRVAAEIMGNAGRAVPGRRNLSYARAKL